VLDRRVVLFWQVPDRIAESANNIRGLRPLRIECDITADSNNNHALPLLRNAVLFDFKQLELHVIPTLAKILENILYDLSGLVLLVLGSIVSSHV